MTNHGWQANQLTVKVNFFKKRNLESGAQSRWYSVVDPIDIDP